MLGCINGLDKKTLIHWNPSNSLKVQPLGQAAECKTKGFFGMFSSRERKEWLAFLYLPCISALFSAFCFVFAVSSNVCVSPLRSSVIATPGLWCCACIGCPITGRAALSSQTQTCSSSLTILHSLMPSLSLSNYFCCCSLPEDGRVVALSLKLLWFNMK